MIDGAESVFSKFDLIGALASEPPAAPSLIIQEALFSATEAQSEGFSFVAQRDVNDSGAACLAMVCRHFEVDASPVRVRQLIDA